MSRRRTLGTKKRIALLAGAAAVAGSGAFALAATSRAAQPEAPHTLSAGDSTACQGLATALGDNQGFIDGQRAHPDAQSAARIANREAVIEEIKRKQAASGCPVGESAQDPPAGPQAQNGGQTPGGGAQTGGERSAPPAQNGGTGSGTGSGSASGQQVCAGSTVTLSGEGGAPAASSDRFPAGTTLKVTNLDNAKSTTVKVTSVSGSCVLLNDAAFEQVREPGKFLIRHARIEKVG
ncbi:RlpA-like double-psi beta-barrel domain-containing protein [Streptomyces similanensis]|uniref:Secreted protein n=1 Tax=Streptomyces similanensis TaxID=1274988 RepID=A0ABP9K4E7_9ACTN